MKKDKVLILVLLSLAGGISFSFSSFIYDMSIDSYRPLLEYLSEAGIISIVFLIGIYFLRFNKKVRE